jgi:hypothetical protein
MHHEHVMDAFTMMESGAITILMDMTMVTSLENVDLHVLFVYIYFLNYPNSQMIPFCYKFLFFFLTFINKLLVMFLPPTSCFNPVTYPLSNKPYPPAILVKHHTWFLQDTNLFISCDHILDGVHQSHFNQSPLFQEIVHYGGPNKIGVNPYHPIAFDTLIKEVFNNFLHLLYFRTKHLEHLTPEDWLNTKCLSTDWHFS